MAGWPTGKAGWFGPFAPPSLLGFIARMGRSVSPLRIGTLLLMGLPLGVLPWHRSGRFPRSAEEPEPGSRRLCAGHRSGSRQVSPELVPGQQLDPGFDGVPTLSTRCRRFTFVRLPDSHLTGRGLPFPDRSRPRLLTPAASGGLEPDPAARFRGAFPHLLYSTMLQAVIRTSLSHLRGAQSSAYRTRRPTALHFASQTRSRKLR